MAQNGGSTNAFRYGSSLKSIVLQKLITGLSIRDVPAQIIERGTFTPKAIIHYSDGTSNEIFATWSARQFSRNSSGQFRADCVAADTATSISAFLKVPFAQFTALAPIMIANGTGACCTLRFQEPFPPPSVAAGGTRSTMVIGPAECEWSASTISDWITIQTAGGSGGSQLRYTVATNPLGQSRTGVITISGGDALLQLPVTQQPSESRKPRLQFSQAIRSGLVCSNLIDGTASDNRAVTEVWLKVNGGTPVKADGLASWTLHNGLIEGENTVTAWAIDSSNNRSENQTRMVNYAPGQMIRVNIIGDGTVTGVKDCECIAPGSHRTAVAHPGRGSRFGAWSGDLASTNPRLEVVMIPSLTVTASFNDVEMPAISIRNPRKRSVVQTGTLFVEGNALDRYGVPHVEVWANDSSKHAAFSMPSGPWYAWVGPIVPGDNQINALARDDAGLETTDTITVTGSRFKNRAGTYNGFFGSPTRQSAVRCGTVQVTLDELGRFTGQLRLLKANAPFSGAIAPDGQATNTLKLSGQTMELRIALNLDAPPDSESTLEGWVQNQDADWWAPLQVHRAGRYVDFESSPFQGSYTVTLPGKSPSDGVGYLTAVVDDNGKAQLVGKVADGTAISFSSPVASSGYLPVYVALYQGRGLMAGWWRFRANGSPQNRLNGNLVWLRTTSEGTGGFTNETEIVSSVHEPSGMVLDRTSIRLIVRGGGLPDVFSNQLELGPDYSVVNNTLNQPLTWSFNPSLGRFTGRLALETEPATRLSLEGVVLQHQRRGDGFFKSETGEIGHVELGP